MKRETLDALNKARAEKRPVVLLLSLADGAHRIIDPAVDGMPDGALGEAVADALRTDRSRTVELDGGECFLQVFNPPLRLVVVGAVHITQFLVPMAVLAGYQVTVVDPRRSFATPERFPNVDLRSEWPDEVLESLALDTRTAVVTLTHDPKLDDPALHAALAQPVFYIGCLGSRRTHAGRLDRLRAAGFDDMALGRIRGPIGLDIGARSPAEVAVATLAQIIACLRGSALG
jgi:xanthine dehydrogenase accessory factor